MLLFWIVALGVGVFSQEVFAFPEMVRHGYVNCTACHVSPTGGGVLSSYGRELSRELLSQTGTEKESGFAFGQVQPPEWLQLGGDYRGLYIYRDTPTVREGHFIQMQADLEAAASAGPWTLDLTLGYQNADTADIQKTLDHFLSRRHYFMYKTGESSSLRAGKFQPAYGLGLSEHVYLVRRGISFNDEGYETYNLEASWLGEKYQIQATGIFGRLDQDPNRREKGFSFVPSVSLGDASKAGLSYFHGDLDGRSRHLLGPYAILGFTHHFYLLSELDFQKTQSNWGFADLQRLGYEWFQGFHTYLQQEYLKTDFSNPRSVAEVYGLGLQYYPRPHFEFQLAWQKRRTAQVASDFDDYAFLLLHFYP